MDLFFVFLSCKLSIAEQNETLPRVHRRQLLSVSLCFGFLYPPHPPTPPPTPTHPPPPPPPTYPPHPPPTYPHPHPPTYPPTPLPPPPPTHLPPPPPTHPPLRFTREQTRVEYIRRCRLIN